MGRFMKMMGQLCGWGLLFAVLCNSAFAHANSGPEENIEHELAFGTQSSPVKVYVFTDWLCPPCKKWEPELVKILPKLYQKSEVIFVDFAIHPASKNFIPYDLSFAIHDKDKYIQLRQALFNLSSTTQDPSESDINEAAKNLGVHYKALDGSTISTAEKYFGDLIKKYKVDRTPTVVVVNTAAGRITTLAGLNELSPDKVLQAAE